MTAFEQHQQFMSKARDERDLQYENERIQELERENADLRLQLEQKVQLRTDLEAALECWLNAEEIPILKRAQRLTLTIYKKIKEAAL
jgi:hypothetical protein